MKPSKRAKHSRYQDADYWFGQCVKHRDNWTCRICGKRFPEKSDWVECMHLDKRGKHQSRFKGSNALTGCKDCHGWAETHPKDFTKWLEGKKQPEVWCLKEAKDVLRNLPEIARHYQAQYERMVEEDTKTFEDWAYL